MDDKADALDGFEGNYPPIIGPVEPYEIQSDDVFICALGDPKWRRHYVEIIRNKGGHFIQLIDPKAIVHPSAKIGEGVMIGPYCCISANTEIGDFTVVHPFCNFGHDSKIGEFCEIESYSFMGGFSSVGNNVTLHTRATILPHMTVEDNAVVGAGSVVIRKVKAGTTVFGVPASKIEF